MMKQQLKNIARPVWRRYRHWMTAARLPNQGMRELYQAMIQKSPRTAGRLNVFGWDIEYEDAQALYSMLSYQVIKGWNDFYTTRPNPYILDCGANIGISVLRFKQLHPGAKIIAFEPDGDICAMLKRNIERNHLKDIEIVQAAVWTENTHLQFVSDGLMGGHLTTVEVESTVTGKSNTVKAIRLTDYLDKPVDLLKIDIEGAELPVLKSCAAYLHYVEKIIVEVHHNVDQPEVSAEILHILAQAGFKVSINSDWRLIYLNPPFVRDPNAGEFDQYIVVCGWR